MAQLQVRLVAVERIVWSGEADMVVARTTDGELGVLPGHIPLLGQLVDDTEVRVKRDGDDLTWKIDGGFLSVTDDGVSVLAESAEPVDDQAR